MFYTRNLIHLLTFMAIALSVYSVGYVKAMDLHKAIQKGDIEAVKYLIENKANLNLLHQVTKPLHVAVGIGNSSIEVIRCLVKNKAKLNVRDDKDKTPLHMAVGIDNISVEVIKCLVEHGAKLNVQDNTNKTPLHIVVGAKTSSIEVIRYLVESKSDVNVQDDMDETPVHRAIDRNLSTEIIQYLLDNKADVNVQDENQYTYFDMALVRNLPLEIIKCLIENKANVNFQHESEETPLHRALSTNHSSCKDIVKYLIQNKADINIRCHDRTFWEFLVECYPQYIDSFYKSAAVDFGIEDCEGKTILDYSHDKELYNEILNLHRRRTPEETQQVKTFLMALKLFESNILRCKVPKPLLKIIFSFARIPTYGKVMKVFDLVDSLEQFK